LKCDDLILLLPSDHYVADGPAFRRAVADAAPAALAGRLVTFGVVPSRPDTGYGYIKVRDDAPIASVERFVEKPDAATAEAYVAEGTYFWNAGIFLMRASKLLEEMARFRPDILHSARSAVAGGRDVDGAFYLEERAFFECPSESLDYAVMEKTNDAVMARIDIGWSDIGGFDALWEASPKDVNGNAGDPALTLDVRNSYVRSDGPMVAVIGVSELIVVIQNGAVLIAAKSRAQDVKKIVDQLHTEGRIDQL
jgi:mannose-1-phosphate guanylyltransferase/mannose-6-phosphate isomerase